MAGSQAPIAKVFNDLRAREKLSLKDLNKLAKVGLEKLSCMSHAIYFPTMQEAYRIAIALNSSLFLKEYLIKRKAIELADNCKIERTIKKMKKTFPDTWEELHEMIFKKEWGN